MTRYWREGLLGFAALLGIAAALFAPPIPQDPHYHGFADTRDIAGVPNFWSVLSNIGFVLVGAYGLVKRQELRPPSFRPAYRAFCIAVLFALRALLHLEPPRAPARRSIDSAALLRVWRTWPDAASAMRPVAAGFLDPKNCLRPASSIHLPSWDLAIRLRVASWREFKQDAEK